MTVIKNILRRISAVPAVLLAAAYCHAGSSAAGTAFPLPLETAVQSGCLKLPEKTGIAHPAGLKTAAEELRKLCLARGIRLVPETPDKATIRLSLRKEGTPKHDEGYTLSIDGGGVEISARAEAGLFYGLQTLRSMLTTAGNEGLPHCRIADRPQFDLRGVAFSLRGAGADDLKQLESFLRTAAALKYNCAALEFGDNFPYEKNPFTARKRQLKAADIREILDCAEKHFIKVVPLLRIWNDCPMLAAYPCRDELLEIPYGKFMRYSYCPRNRELLALIGKAAAGQTALLGSGTIIFHLDRTGLRQTSRHCAQCRGTELAALAAGHFGELNKICAAAGIKAEFLLSADPSRPPQPGPEKTSGLSAVFRQNRIPEAPLGHPELMRHNIRRAAGAGERRFILDGMASIRSGMLPPLANNTVYSAGGLVDGAGYLWSGAESRRHPDAVAYFFALFHERRFGGDAANAAPVPLDRSVNVALNHCEAFPAFAPEEFDKLVRDLAAGPEKFRLTTGRGRSYYGILLSGGRADSPYPGRAEIALGGVRAAAADLLLSCSKPPQQSDYSPWHGGGKIFAQPQTAAVTFKYENGRNWSFKLRYTNSVTDWNHPYGGYKLRIAAAAADTMGRYCHFDALRIKNPHPELALKSLVLSSSRHDGIAPALLALSLEDVRGGKLPAGTFDGVSLPLPRRDGTKSGGEYNIQWDFEDAALKNAYAETVNMVFPAGKAVGIDYVADTASPSHSRVLRVTIPPATAEKPELPLKLVVNFPWTPRGTVKSLVLSCRVDRPECLKGAFQMLVNTIDRSSYAQEFFPTDKWERFHSALGNRDAQSANPLRDVRRCNMRKAVFVFRELPRGAEVRLDDIGISRLDCHDLPAFMAE